MRTKTAIRKLQAEPYRGLELTYGGVRIGWVISEQMLQHLAERAGYETREVAF